MPNKRDPQKRIVSFWLPEELKARLQRIAKARGVSLSDLLIDQMQELAKGEDNGVEDKDDGGAGREDGAGD